MWKSATLRVRDRKGRLRREKNDRPDDGSSSIDLVEGVGAEAAGLLSVVVREGPIYAFSAGALVIFGLIGGVRGDEGNPAIEFGRVLLSRRFCSSKPERGMSWEQGGRWTRVIASPMVPSHPKQ